MDPDGVDKETAVVAAGGRLPELQGHATSAYSQMISQARLVERPLAMPTLNAGVFHARLACVTLGCRVAVQVPCTNRHPTESLESMMDVNNNDTSYTPARKFQATRAILDTVKFANKFRQAPLAEKPPMRDEALSLLTRAGDAVLAVLAACGVNEETGTARRLAGRPRKVKTALKIVLRTRGTRTVVSSSGVPLASLSLAVLLQDAEAFTGIPLALQRVFRHDAGGAEVIDPHLSVLDSDIKDHDVLVLVSAAVEHILAAGVVLLAVAA